MPAVTEARAEATLKPTLNGHRLCAGYLLPAHVRACPQVASQLAVPGCKSALSFALQRKYLLLCWHLMTGILMHNGGWVHSPIAVTYAVAVID
jgi:hypothetical protein